MQPQSDLTSGPRHRRVIVHDVPIHVVEQGDPQLPAAVLLHGWPEDWSVFRPVMHLLREVAHVIALDLPGIGGSPEPTRANDKRTLAAVVHTLLSQLGLHDVTLVGRDVGGQIAYAYLHTYPGELAAAVLMNIAVPGVAPWSEVERNPRIWHFAFHNVPDLPEKLVTGKEAEYFAFFYDALSAAPGGVDAASRQAFAEAYLRPSALRTGFDWYRAFAEDERDNREARGHFAPTPVLCLRGDHDFGDIHTYLSGLRESGLSNVRGEVIAQCGHFAPLEQPRAVANAIAGFMRR
ncbi:MAG TPA: alpha/beta hydrolase [Polyangiales bacterium]|nr:alpha/beta hydrolase [Polyangiales bacterium]